MNFKIKLMFASLLLINFAKSSCMQTLSQIGSSAFAGAAARTLIVENLPGFFIEPSINNLKNKIEAIKKEKESKDSKNKLNWKKWAHFGSAGLNIWNILLAYKFIYKYDKGLNQIGHSNIGKFFLVPAILGMAAERSVIESLKDIKMLKKHEEALDMSMPVVLAALQYFISQK